MKNVLILFCFLFVGYSQFVNCQATITLDSTVLTENELAIGIQVPWEIAWGPDDMIWVTEKRGQVLRIDPETGNTSTALNIQSQVHSGSEPGLLGMAFHPDFINEPKVYLVYTYRQSGSTKERLSVFDWNGTSLTNELTLLENITGAGIHNGSRLLISTDNKIFMTVGDAGDAGSSQVKSSLNGKLLRMNLDGSIPKDNPNPASLVYSFGHRNSQGLAYGPNGNIYSSEHGQNRADEFNIIEIDRNYGWPNVEGMCNTNNEITFCNANNVKEPMMEWTPCVAVNGLSYYSHSAIPEWNGKMLMAVLGGFARLPRLSVLTFNEDGTEVTQEDQYFSDYGRIRDVCVNPNTGSIYFATNGFNYPSTGPNRIIEYKNLDFTSSNTEVENELQFLKVYPNPFNNSSILRVEFSENFNRSQYEIFDFNGKRIETGVLKQGLLEINTASWSPGSYYIKAENEKGRITKKIIVSN